MLLQHSLQEKVLLQTDITDGKRISEGVPSGVSAHQIPTTPKPGILVIEIHFIHPIRRRKIYQIQL